MRKKRNATANRRRRASFHQLEPRQMLTAAPTTLDLAPSHSFLERNTAETITAQFSDSDGVADIRVADFQVYNGEPEAPRCFVRYDAKPNVFTLWDDASASFMTAGAPGSSSSISNGNCTFDAAPTGVRARDATPLEVEFNLTFEDNFDGPNDIWLRAFDFGNLSSSAAVRGQVTFMSKPLVGDIDQDGIVSFADFLKLSNDFGKTVEPGTGGDLDGDATVSFADFLILAANFGATA